MSGHRPGVRQGPRRPLGRPHFDTKSRRQCLDEAKRLDEAAARDRRLARAQTDWRKVDELRANARSLEATAKAWRRLAEEATR